MDRSELESRISNDRSPVSAARQLQESYDADADAFREGADVGPWLLKADTVDTVLG